jgi:polyhydroxybutyrate depolymerase
MNRTVKIIVILLLIVVIGAIRHHWRGESRSEPGPSTAGQTASYAPGDYRGSLLTPDGRTRTYIVHIPLGFPTKKPYPLVLVFHGGMGTGARAKKATNFDAKADAKGFIVVYPDGIGHHWNDGRGNVNPTIDDVGFVRQLIGNLVSRLPIDSRRIYAAGISNGGHFSLRLGCELADVLAAVATDIGPMPANLLPVCKPVRPIGVIGIQGAADPITPVGGGEVASSPMFGLGKGGEVESAEKTMNFWASVNGCASRPTLVREPPRVNDGTSVEKYTYAGCNSGGSVVYYIVQGMGHSWPPQVGPAPQITGPTSYNINATDLMWDFFSAISR